MRRVVILMLVLLVSFNICGQEPMKKIALQEGIHNIEYDHLNLTALLQVYNEESATHLIGDLFLSLEHDGEEVASFYVEIDTSAKEYLTKIYKNYLLTFMIENSNRYLIIEKADFGKKFALSSNRSATIGNPHHAIELAITDYIYESGYDGPPEDENRNYFTDVHYTLKVKVKDVVKNFSFYSSEIKGDFIIELQDYEIQILSDLYKNSYCLIEMVVHRKEDK
ncbi:hypothetical protein SAMN05661096_03805 [Marivirga sericea]|uniref:Uncharacterized protein n=1 Tax=Marivirga sericea TaxID=1028 RepID=A0A1X7LCT5_9BACT|nr:hypothetical protein [Marivirga sericea]SMG51676.1 hypothetical protein SAMN05661096_03805 [Marivirga sericea]